jgi:predicted nucleic acid-binding protein
MDFGVAQLDGLLSRFALVFELPLRRTVWLSSITIMAESRLRPYDAVHVATARAEGLRDFATADGHFRKINDLTVWLTRDSPDDGSDR